MNAQVKTALIALVAIAVAVRVPQIKAIVFGA